MAETLGQAVLELTTDEESLKSGISKAKKSAENLQKQFNKIGKNLTKFVTLPILAISGVMVKAFGDQEEAEKRLNAAIKTTGREADISIDALKNMASGLQEVTKFGDEATLSALALLQQLANLDQRGLEKITPAILDFAEAMDVDLATAATLVGKTLGSTTNALARYGIEIDPTADKQEKLIQLTEALNEKFEGTATAVSETLLGSLQQLKNAVGDLGESFGKIISEMLLPFIERIRSIVKRFSEMDEGTKRIIVRIALFAAAVGPAILITIKLIAAFKAVRTAIIATRLAVATFTRSLQLNPVFLAISAITLLAAGVVTLVKRLREGREAEDEFTKSTEEMREEIERANEAWEQWETDRIAGVIGRLKDDIANLTTVLKDENLNLIVRNITQERLNKLLEEHVRLTGEAWKETKILAEWQIKEAEVIGDVADGLEIIALKSKVYGEAFDATTEKTKLYKSAIDELLESGLNFTEKADFIVKLTGLIDEMNQSLIEQKELEDLIRNASTEGIDAEIELFKQRDEQRRNLEKAWLSFQENSKQKEVDDTRAAEAEKQQLRQETFSFATNLTSALGTVFSNFYQGQIDAAEGNEEVQKRIALRQAKAAKTFALFTAIIQGFAAVNNAMAAIPFSAARVAFAVITGLANVASVASQPLPKLQAGADFIVPPGFEGDKFPMLAESGERVQVTPRSEAENEDDMIHNTINLDGKVIQDFITKAIRDKRIIVSAEAIS